MYVAPLPLFQNLSYERKGKGLIRLTRLCINFISQIKFAFAIDYNRSVARATSKFSENMKRKESIF